jgi:hypothetical protein
MKEEISNAKPSEKKKMVTPVGYLGQTALKRGAMWHTEWFLGNARKISTYTIAVGG